MTLAIDKTDGCSLSNKVFYGLLSMNAVLAVHFTVFKVKMSLCCLFTMYFTVFMKSSYLKGYINFEIVIQVMVNFATRVWHKERSGTGVSLY